MLALTAIFAAAVFAEAASAKRPRPSKSVVKRVVSEHWDTDRTGPDYTKLVFHSITIGKTRRRHINERAPADYVTPVTAVFTQTITYVNGTRDVSRITQRALFYKGSFDWAYHSKGASIKYIERA
jgi:hypothetical protein